MSPLHSVLAVCFNMVTDSLLNTVRRWISSCLFFSVHFPIFVKRVTHKFGAGEEDEDEDEEDCSEMPEVEALERVSDDPTFSGGDGLVNTGWMSAVDNEEEKEKDEDDDDDDDVDNTRAVLRSELNMTRWSLVLCIFLLSSLCLYFSGFFEFLSFLNQQAYR